MGTLLEISIISNRRDRIQSFNSFILQWGIRPTHCLVLRALLRQETAFEGGRKQDMISFVHQWETKGLPFNTDCRELNNSFFSELRSLEPFSSTVILRWFSAMVLQSSWDWRISKFLGLLWTWWMLSEKAIRPSEHCAQCVRSTTALGEMCTYEVAV